MLMTTDDACLHYKLTYEPSAQVSYKPCAEHHEWNSPIPDKLQSQQVTVLK